MKDEDKSRSCLIRELGELRGRLAELEVQANLRCQAEGELRESERRFQATFEQAAVGVAHTAPDGSWLRVNERLAGIVGYEREELLGLSFQAITHPDDVDKDVQNLRRLLSGEIETYSTEKRYVRKDGATVWIDLTASLVRDDSGEPAYFIAVIEDITLRKRAEKELASRARQQAAVARLGQRALEEPGLSRLMDEAVSVVARTLGVEYCKVLELQPGGESLLLKAGIGWREGLVGAAAVGAGLDSQAGYTLASEEPVVVEDLGDEDRFDGPPLLREHGVVSGASVVVGERDRPYGVLGAHTGERRVFTDDDVNFLRAIANVLAVAVRRERIERDMSRLASYPELNPSPVIETSAAGEVTYLNPAARRWFPGLAERGGAHPVLAGLDAVHEEIVGSGVEPAVREVTLDGCFYQQAISRVPRSGLLRIYMLDTTERRRAEEALRDSEERFRTVFEGATVGMVALTLEGRFLETNPAVHRILGYSAEELRGMSFRDLTHPDDAAPNVRLHGELAAGEREGYGIEKRYVTKDGRVGWGWVNVSLIRHSDGTPRFAFSVLEDITERKRAEEEIREQARLLELTRDAITVCDMDGAITFWNRGAEEIYGWSREEALGRKARELLQTRLPDDLRRIIGELERAGHWEGEVTHERRDGERVVVASRWALKRDGRGEPAAVLQIDNDVTLQKRTEEALAEIRQAERRRISRDLHDVVLQDLAGTLQTLQLAQLRARQSGSQVYLEEEILALRRATQGLRSAVYELRFEKEQPFLTAVESLVELNRQMAAGRRTDLVVGEGFPEDLPDPAGVEMLRVIQEALTNVRHHSGARHARVELWMEREAVGVEVYDDGRGFDAQASRSGVGLSAMRERVAGLGGELEVRSQPREGTRVTLKVPVRAGTRDPLRL